MDEKFLEMWEEYHNRFGEWFPTMCFQTDTEKQTLEKMSACLKEDKRAEELYNLDYSKNLY